MSSDSLMSMRELVEKASGEWGLNCGPGALLAVTGLTPEQLRPFLGDFEEKRYTSPTLMMQMLARLQLPYRIVYKARPDVSEEDGVSGEIVYPSFGLVRVQWGGRWTNDGVPIRVRYRHSHWIAVWDRSDGEDPDNSRSVFDVNHVFGDRGFLPMEFWSRKVVPFLLEDVAHASGAWWPTHCWEIDRNNDVLSRVLSGDLVA